MAPAPQAPRRKPSPKPKAGGRQAAAAAASEGTAAGQGPPAADRILREDLPKAAEDFAAAYGGVKEAAQLLAPAAPGPARRLGQVTRHLRDVSWPLGLAPSQAQRLAASWQGVLPVAQTLLTLAAALDFDAALSRGTAAAAFLSAAVTCLEVSAAYCALAGTLGTPAAVLVEEVGLGVVQALRQCMRQLVTPLLSPPEQDRRRGAAAGAAAAASKAVAGHYGPQEAAEACAGAAAVMQELHEFLCRHRLADEQLHQLVHLAAGVFFCPEPSFPLCAAAEELLVTIFCRREALRSSVLQELLAAAPKLPSGKRARKFFLPVGDENADHGLTTWTRLLLRLVQSTCLPLRETVGAEVEFSAVLSHRVAAQAVLVQLTSGLFQRLLLARARDEESRAILEGIIDELLTVAFRPPWPGALALVRTASQQLIGVVQPERKKEAADASIREFALKLLSKVVTRLWHHHVDASKGRISLPPWDQAPEEASREERILQHIALRASLDEGRPLPWTPAARAVEAWDAELFLGKEGVDQTGLCHFTDDVVFRYLTMAHLEDERAVPARVPHAAGAPVALSAAVFSAGHPAHARTFLVGDWAEACARARRAREQEAGEPQAAEASSRRAPPRDQHAVLEELLAGLWTSRAAFEGEGSAWRSGGGRRVLLPFAVYKVYRQLRLAELDGLRRAALDCVVMQANAAQASLRKTAMRTLSDLVAVDPSVLELKAVEETVDMRLRDESSWVRQVSLDLLGRVLEGSLAGPEDEAAADESQPIRLDPSAQAGASASAMLLRFHQTVRGRINDTSVLVRRQASKILSAFVLNQPEHPAVVEVALDLMRRSTDSEILRNLVLGTFELLWFMDDEPTPRAAQQFAHVVDASRSAGLGATGGQGGDVLDELLRRFKKNISSRRHSRGFEFAVRRWTTLLLNEFVQLSATAGGGPAAESAGGQAERRPPAGGGAGRQLTRTETAGSEAEPPPGLDDAPWVRRRALLSTLEAFAAVRPREMQVHLRPLAVYLALEEGAPSEERWVALKACRILSAVLPYVAERRGLMDHRQVQQDLQALIQNQPSAGVHEAVRCLCLVVKHVTGDLNQLVLHLNTAVPTLSKLCSRAEAKAGCLERIEIMYMSRQVWILSSVLESLAIDDYVQKSSGEAAVGSSRRLLPRSALPWDFVGGSVASTVADLLVRLYALGAPQLRAVVVTCLGFFLRGQRPFVKDKRVAEIFGSALAAGELGLCLKALEALASLLAHFGSEADKETRAGAKDFHDMRDGVAAGGGAKAVEAFGGRASAVESAQPLAAHSEAVLAHVALAGSIGPGKDAGDRELLRVRAEALAVIRQLHRQGLVNPMQVLPKVFALSFAGEAVVAEPACSMLKEVLEIRPTLLLNRLDEAFREAFLAVLAGGRPAQLGDTLGPARLAALGEVYAERFRRQKTTREAFIRKALREVIRLGAGSSLERFAELFAAARQAAAPAQAAATEEPPERPPPAKRLRRSGGQAEAAEAAEASPEALLARLPLLQYYQVLYAQFVASALSSLPFVYESEPLLVVFECNHHLSLRAGTLFSNFDRPEAAPGSPERGAAAAPAGGAAAGAAAAAPGERAGGGGGEAPQVDAFAEAVAILACLLLKRAMKAEYSLSAEQCAQFNPKEPRQERLRSGLAAPVRGGGAAPAGLAADDAAAGAVRARFPAAEWLALVAPLAAAFAKPAEIAAYVRRQTDGDPWDHSHGRHAAALERLEGRRPAAGEGRRGRQAAGRPAAGGEAEGAGRRATAASATAAPAAASAAAPARRARGAAAAGRRSGRGRPAKRRRPAPAPAAPAPSPKRAPRARARDLEEDAEEEIDLEEEEDDDEAEGSDWEE